MNNLSVLIYIAEVLPRISVAAVSLAAAWVVVHHILQLIKMESSNHIWSSDTPEQVARKKKHQAEGFIVGKGAIAFLIVAILVKCIIPSKETMYLMAGSEAAEYAVTSDYGKELVSDIQAVIKKQLEELK